MRFKDRVAWFLATLLVSASIAFSFPAIAAAATYYPCSGTVSDNYIGFVYRNVATYKAVSGRSIVQNVHGCTGSYSGTYGDFVFPANIEQVGELRSIRPARVWAGLSEHQPPMVLQLARQRGGWIRRDELAQS